jgi:hypothetical protein
MVLHYIACPAWPKFRRRRRKPKKATACDRCTIPESIGSGHPQKTRPVAFQEAGFLRGFHFVLEKARSGRISSPPQTRTPTSFPPLVGVLCFSGNIIIGQGLGRERALLRQSKRFLLLKPPIIATIMAKSLPWPFAVIPPLCFSPVAQSEISPPTPASSKIGQLSQAHSFRRITSFRLTYIVGRIAPTSYWATWTQQPHRFADEE